MKNIAKRLASVIKSHQHVGKSAEFIRTHSLLIGMVFVVSVALVVTAINMALYTMTGASKLDLSRPGYESARKEVISEDRLNSSKGFSGTGKLTKKELDTYMADFRKQQQALRKYDTFDSKALDNSQLSLPVEAEQTQTTPTE